MGRKPCVSIQLTFDARKLMTFFREGELNRHSEGTDMNLTPRLCDLNDETEHKPTSSPPSKPSLSDLHSPCSPFTPPPQPPPQPPPNLPVPPPRHKMLPHRLRHRSRPPTTTTHTIKVVITLVAASPRGYVCRRTRDAQLPPQLQLRNGAASSQGGGGA